MIDRRQFAKGAITLAAAAVMRAAVRTLLWFSDARIIAETIGGVENSFRGPSRVLVDWSDVTSHCYGVYRYSDGTTDLHMYETGEDSVFKLTPDRKNVETRIDTFPSESVVVTPVGRIPYLGLPLVEATAV